MIEYPAFRALMEAGAIQSFEDFFLFISASQLSKDASIPYGRLKQLRLLPRMVTLHELYLMSEVIGTNITTLGSVIHSDERVKEQ